MLQYIDMALVEHGDWERRFNARAARGEFARNFEEKRPGLVDVLLTGPSDLACKALFSIATLSSWIQRLRRVATAASSGIAD
jgi:hypothetical protein